MLAERVAFWEEQLRNEGERKGESRGVQRTEARQKARLERQARLRFGDSVTRQLGDWLQSRSGPKGLDEAADWIVICDSADDLLARIRAE